MCGYARITIGYILEGVAEDAPHFLRFAAENLVDALCIVQQEIQNTLMEEPGVPSLLPESDVVEASSFNEAQTMTRIDTFTEVVLERARRREWLPPPEHRHGPEE
jgi:hypothetical protein